MRIVSNAILIVSGVYLALGLIYLRYWWSERARWDYLAFALCALPITLYSWCELGLMHSQTGEEYLFYAWWSFIVGNTFTVSIAWFAYVKLNSRRWLFFTYCALRAFGIFVHFILPNGINFREITSVGQINVLGETLSYPIGVRNSWMILPLLLHLLLTIFCLNASIRSWRRGKRRRALIFGGGIVLFGLVILLASINLYLAFLPFPVYVSFAIFFVIAAMFYELNYNIHRAAMLAGELEKREAELKFSLYNLNVSANAANVGLWSKNLGEDKVWVSQKTRELWGFSDSTPSVMEEFAKRVHPDDLEHFSKIIIEAEEKETEFRVEYRIIQPDQSTRWVVSVGRVELVNERAKALRGATVDITARKLAEEKARLTEEQNTAIVAAIPDMMFILDSAGFYLAVHAKHHDDPVLPPEELRGKSMCEVLPKALTDEFFRSFEHAAETHEPQIVEYKLSSKDEERWYEARIVRMGENFLSVVRDITKMKLANEAVHDLSRRLINAQEKERARLALELHDDLNQHLALLSIQLSVLRNGPDDVSYIKEQIQRLGSDIAQVTAQVRRISHELHPARLKQLGLETALHGLCHEIAAAYPIKINFAVENLPRKLPDDLSLCFYRVAQESLQNIIKHSEANAANVDIKLEDERLHLSISDNGKGFDIDSVTSKKSLGLVSIDERVRAVDGTLKINSTIGTGTKIEVSAPLNSNI